MSVDRSRAFCVVGAGSSGLAALKALREHGFDADAFEREDDVGGNWNFGKSGSRVYASTHTISSRPFTEYPDFPMPDSYPDYPHHSQIHAYLRRYAEHFGLLERIAFQTSVERMEPAAEGGWDVTIAQDGKRETRRYAGVVIANGHNWFPKIPEYPGEFSGETMHSARYKTPDVLRGKRVLVVGAGNTGCDVAVEAAQNATRTLHSTRRGYWYAQKYSFGRPSDQIYDLVLSLRLPSGITRRVLEGAAKITVGDLTRFGLPKPDHAFRETHPIINSQLVYYVGHGDILPKPDVERFEGRHVVFRDGSREEVDLVLYCTGYLIRFPFLDEAHLNYGDGRPRLYKNVFHPHRDDLFVVGLIQPDSGQFKLVHWQSVAVARFLEALAERPSRAARFRERRLKHLVTDLGAGIHYKESTRHYLEIQHMSYLRGLADDIESLA